MNIEIDCIYCLSVITIHSIQCSFTQPREKNLIWCKKTVVKETR